MTETHETHTLGTAKVWIPLRRCDDFGGSLLPFVVDFGMIWGGILEPQRGHFGSRFASLSQHRFPARLVTFFVLIWGPFLVRFGYIFRERVRFVIFATPPSRNHEF